MSVRGGKKCSTFSKKIWGLVLIFFYHTFCKLKYEIRKSFAEVCVQLLECMRFGLFQQSFNKFVGNLEIWWKQKLSQQIFKPSPYKKVAKLNKFFVHSGLFDTLILAIIWHSHIELRILRWQEWDLIILGLR